MENENISPSAIEVEERENESIGEKNPSRLDRFLGIIFPALVFLLPIVFIPSSSIQFLFTKQLVFVTALVVVFVAWILKRLKEGRYELPASSVVLSMGVVVLVSLISAFFSGSVKLSVLGQGFEVGTVVSIFVGFLTIFLIPLFLRTKDKVFSAFSALFISFAVVAVFLLARLFISPNFLSFGVFGEATANPVGKWNDLGVFFGLITTLALITLEFFPLSKRMKVISYVSLFVALFFLALVNFSAIWLVLALLSVILFVYLYSFSKGPKIVDRESAESDKPKRRLPVATLIVAVVSLLFIIFGSYINNKLSEKFNISQLEVRPSWQATFTVAKNTLKHDPILGAGPNQFVREWLKYKDPAVNGTIFWNADFNYGVGLIPTFLITTGLLGLLAWLAFFFFFVFSGFRSVFSPSSDPTLRYLTISSFLGAMFIWIFSVFYAPGNVVTALAFILTGIFVSCLSLEGHSKIKTGSYTSVSKVSFGFVLLFIVFIVVSVATEYFMIQRFMAYTYFQKGLVVLNTTGDFDKAEVKILKATSLSKNDLFYRALSEIGIIRLNNLVATTNDKTPIDTIRAQFQNVLGSTLEYAKQAIAIDEKNYENHVSLGRVYETVVPLKIEGAYEAAKITYEEALKHNPHSPAIYLMLARLEFSKGDNVKTRDYIAQALAKKQNYIDAIFLLAQLEVKEGNTAAAIASVESASVLSPNDPTILFQLGLLKFNNRDYKGAEAVLSQAIALNPVYANVKYFLGLSYEKLGKQTEAIAQFEDLVQSNPDNEEVKLILSNLKAGRSPFAEATDDKPEKRKTPPVEETGAKKTKSTASEE